jgi:hypothetical protein
VYGIVFLGFGFKMMVIFAVLFWAGFDLFCNKIVLNRPWLSVGKTADTDLFIRKVADIIHIKPELLPAVYQNMYDLSNRYIMVYEYYNPTPVNVEYRGYQNRLFKRDFAGELIDKYNLKLIDYGFNYKREKY